MDCSVYATVVVYEHRSRFPRNLKRKMSLPRVGKEKGAAGLNEVRIHLGPGYRLYFGKAQDTLVIILCGGDKGTQERDIQKAKEYWQLYKDSLKQR
jgi:putative addiction module killer protein